MLARYEGNVYDNKHIQQDGEIIYEIKKYTWRKSCHYRK